MSIQSFNDQIIGFIPGAASLSNSNLSLNTANLWGAFSFYLKAAKTLNNLRLYLTENGALAAGEVRVDIFSDSAGTPGQPGTSIANTTNAGAISTGWTDFAFSQALSAQAMYWAVIRNLNGTPGTNFPQIRWSANGGGLGEYLATNATWSVVKKHSTDGGATWAGTVNANIIPSMRLDFSDGTSSGLPVESQGNDTTNSVYSDREVGIMFTTPANVRLRVTGLIFNPAKVGSPTGNVRYRIYRGTTLVATTQEIPLASMTGGGTYAAYFATTLTLEPSTSYRIVMGESTQSDASGNRYQLQFYTIDNNATSLALKPFGGSVKKTYWNGASWTETDTDFCPFGLVFEGSGLFYPVGTDFAYLG